MIDVDTVARNLMEPVLALDADGFVVYANERFLEITQCAREQVLGADYSLLEQFVEDGFPTFRAAAEAVAAADSSHERVELAMLHPEAAPVPRRLPAEARLTPIVEGDARVGVLIVFRNVAERKRHEQELTRQNERLEEFASVVSHDLRNPLNVAEGRLALAAEECDSEHLDQVAYAHDRMSALIEDVLAVARQGDVATEFESVDLAETVDRCWRNVDTADATLTNDSVAVLRADGGRLKQLLENLIRNAVEHGGDDVTITVGDLDTGFFVEDDGAGVPPEEAERVFEMGYSTTPGGLGFGLSIVREIADAHDWDVAVTEGAEGGARFEFTSVDVE